MADPRLDSGHFDVGPRRQAYRRDREALLAARGWLTLAAEGVRGLVGGTDEWPALLPVRPEQVLPGTKYLLLDRQTDCLYPLKTGLNTVGRLPSNDVVLEEQTISRRHCVLLVHAWGGSELHDTASRNGTFVNGQRLCGSSPLASGDEIRVCQRRLLFVSEQDFKAAPAADSHPTTYAL
jgi:hypothetical protein